MLAGSHLTGHGWTPEQYREAFGLNRSQPLLAPALVERRRAEGARRYAANPRLRAGLAVGQQMVRDGSLLALSHQAQRPGTARLQARTGASTRTAPTRRRTADAAAERLLWRLEQLGHPGDLSGYLRQRYLRDRLPVLAIARELGGGNMRIKAMLDQTGVERRQPAGAEAAARRWQRHRAGGEPPSTADPAIV